MQGYLIFTSHNYGNDTIKCTYCFTLITIKKIAPFMLNSYLIKIYGSFYVIIIRIRINVMNTEVPLIEIMYSKIVVLILALGCVHIARNSFHWDEIIRKKVVIPEGVGTIFSGET